MGGGRRDMDGRKSVNGSYDQSGRKSRIPAAYPVTMLVDLQVYVVPREKWVLSRRLYRHNIVDEGISLGFVRVLPQLSIHNLRRELQLQLGPDMIPRDFIFIRSVGNIFIQLKPKQEVELKVKNFIPPFSSEPEIYLLEVLPNEDPRMVSPLPLLLREDTPPHICHELCHHNLARKTVQVITRGSSSPQPTTPFPPVSITPSPSIYDQSRPLSPSEYKDLLEQYRLDESGELTHSQTDLAARQVAYDYENDAFQSPVSSPVNSAQQSRLPRRLTRQKSVKNLLSNEEEAGDSSSNSRPLTNTTESPSSADTVKTAIRRYTDISKSEEASQDFGIVEVPSSSSTESVMESDKEDKIIVKSLSETEEETGIENSTEQNILKLPESPNHINLKDENSADSDPYQNEIIPQMVVVKTEHETKNDTESSSIEERTESSIYTNETLLIQTTNIITEESTKMLSNENITSEEFSVITEESVTSEDNGNGKTESEKSITSISTEGQDTRQQFSETISSDVKRHIATETTENQQTTISTKTINNEGFDAITSHEMKRTLTHDSKEQASVNNKTDTSLEILNTGDKKKTLNMDNKQDSQTSPDEGTNKKSKDRSLRSANRKLNSMKTHKLKSKDTSPTQKFGNNTSPIQKSSNKATYHPVQKPGNKATSPIQKAGVKTTSPIRKPGNKATSPIQKSGEKTTSPIQKSGENTTSPIQKSGENTTSPIQKSGEKTTTPIQKLGNKSTSPSMKPGHKNASPSQQSLDTKMPKLKILRKPSVYPHRMTKTTIARQALAREKRRVYVEERIQSYIKNSPAAFGPDMNHYSKSLMDLSQNKGRNREYRDVESRYLNVMNMGDGKVATKEKVLEKGRITSSVPSNLKHYSMASFKETSAFQFLPEINSINYNFSEPLYFSEPSGDKQQNPKVPYSYYNSPSEMKDILNLNGLKSNSSTSSIPQSKVESSTSRKSGLYGDANSDTSDLWKNVSEQGFFYSFRVRQSGTVQLADKAVQTQDLSESYVLQFPKDSGQGYYLQSQKSFSRTTSSTVHLPPINRDKILRDISETVQLRHDAELRRAELIQRANDLQSMVKEKRDKINRRHEFWHKKYIEESSMTRPFEAACNSLRSELNTVHRRLIAHLEGRDLPLRLRDGPSKKANYKIMAARLQHEIKELQQKAKAAKLRLESEIKLKEQAEREVRDIRNDLAHKKVVMSLARSQIGTLPAAHPRYDTLIY